MSLQQSSYFFDRIIDMKIPAYVINLKNSHLRREYMEKLLSAYPFIDVNFIEAVDGRIMSKDSLSEVFDFDSCIKRNGRIINPGEVGCVLSHRKCYHEMIQSNKDYALILEDDITVVGDMNTAINQNTINFMHSSEPRILFLSGDYWYWRKKSITDVFFAVGGYAYFINRAAAEIVLGINKPYNVADDWDLYKSMGVKLNAVYPYVIDANISGFVSDVKQEHWGILRKEMSLGNVIRSYIVGIVKRFLFHFGHFESKIRV